MADKLIDENSQIERYGRTLKELEAEYGAMTPDELLQIAWSWAGDVVHGANELGKNFMVQEDVQDHIRHSGNIIQWLIGTARKFQREGK